MLATAGWHEADNDLDEEPLRGDAAYPAEQVLQRPQQRHPGALEGEPARPTGMLHNSLAVTQGTPSSRKAPPIV